MATITAFPTPSNSGPVINKQVNYATDFKVGKTLYEDGGCDVDIRPCGPQRIDLEYDGLTQTDAAILDAHFATAKGKTNTFSFFDQRNGLTYTGARYEKYEVDKHSKYWSLARRITLVFED